MENNSAQKCGVTPKWRFELYDMETGELVFAWTMQDAIWAAAKHWKTNPRKAAFHQGCNVGKVSG